MKHYLFLSLFLFTSLSSCLIADDYFTENKKYKISLDKKVKKEITNYIIENSDNYIYKNYGFSQLIITKPVELIVLDDLKNKQALDSTNIDIKLQISKIEKIIKDKNIRYSLEMDHIFSIKNKLTDEIDLFETNFKLADSITVTETTPLLNIKLTPKKLTIFENYFYETPLFSSTDIQDNKILSEKFYTFLKQHQNNLIGIKIKSNFLDHSLNLCNEIKEDGTFDQSYFLTKLADQKLRSDSSIINYKSVKYSELFETKDGELLVNYYFFHTFIQLENNTSDTSTVYIEFSPYYELTAISEIDPQ